MNKVGRAYVHVGDRLVGDLVDPGLPEPSVFVYGTAVPESHSVSVTMPARGVSYSFNRLHPIFAQNLPEGYLGDVLRKTVSKLYGSGDLTLLAALGRYQVGKVVVTASPGLSKLEDDGEGEPLASLVQSSNTALFEELVERYALRSGVSGVQPKVLVPARGAEHATLKTSGFIVKSWGDDYPQLAANEYFCMSVARLAGLPVPDFELSLDGRLFIMKRFDRSTESTWLGFEDACVLQGVGPNQKYTGSYERLAKTLDTFVCVAARPNARRQLFLSLLVSWAVRNGDAHLKNFGIVYEEPFGDRRLAPAYDIVSTTPYLQNDVPALTLAGRKIWWPLSHLRAYGRLTCYLTDREVDAFFRATAKALHEVGLQIARYRDHHPAFADVGEAMIRIFEGSKRELTAALHSES